MSLQFSLFYLLFHLLFIAFIDFTIMCTHAEGQTPKHYYLFALGSALVLAVNTAVSQNNYSYISKIVKICYTGFRSCKTFGDKELMAGSSSRSS